MTASMQVCAVLSLASALLLPLAVPSPALASTLKRDQSASLPYELAFPASRQARSPAMAEALSRPVGVILWSVSCTRLGTGGAVPCPVGPAIEPEQKVTASVWKTLGPLPRTASLAVAAVVLSVFWGAVFPARWRLQRVVSVIRRST